MSSLSNLIEAFQIFLKYGDTDYPTSCEHDTLYVHVDPAIVSAEDLARLAELGFEPSDNDTESFMSDTYGSS